MAADYDSSALTLRDYSRALTEVLPALNECGRHTICWTYLMGPSVTARW